MRISTGLLPLRRSAWTRSRPGGIANWKKEVNIRHIEAVGHYALKLTFTDGHDTGIYSWDYLWSLGKEYEVNWSEYLDRLKKAGATRD